MTRHTAGDSRIWCIVTQPDSICMSLKLKEDAKGQDLLEEVCNSLGIVEKDYFGFQFTSSKGDILWLNMRNRISKQCPRYEIYSFLFCVKFYVAPHQILQESTRRQFYLNVKRDVEMGKLRLDSELSIKAQAFIAQEMAGDFRENHLAYNPSRCNSWTVEFRGDVILQHSQLRGMTADQAQYFFLKEMSTVEGYGMEFHVVKNDDGKLYRLGIGIDCLKIIRSSDAAVERVPYNCLRSATHSGRTVRLDIYATDIGEIESILYKLSNKEAACALYRSITEHHSFYRCDSIRPAVKTQVSKDLFDSLFGWFGDDSSSEQNYIFDTERTCREAYDHARRVLFNFGATAGAALSQKYGNDKTSCSLDNSQEVVELQERLYRFEEALRCQICRDSPIDSVIQCGHMVCCSSCLKQCDKCPLCRADVLNIVHCFLPVDVGGGTSSSAHS